jgi:hypothetical protein
MPLNAQLNPLLVPSGTEFPGTVQGLLQLISEYEEIIGLENFNGVNYGSVTPDPADRDKAWLRTDGGGLFLGWYVWTGAAWEILPAKAFVGTQVERDALPNPQDGTLWHVVGTGISTYVESLNAWEWGFPAASEDLVGDKFYFFSSAQSLATQGGDWAGWNPLDISSYISSASLAASSIIAAIVRIDVRFGPVGFGGAQYFSYTGKMWGSNLVSTAATDVVTVTAEGARDDSSTAAQNTTTGYIPMSGGQTIIYGHAVNQGGPANMNSSFWLIGFIYSPV